MSPVSKNMNTMRMAWGVLPRHLIDSSYYQGNPATHVSLHQGNRGFNSIMLGDIGDVIKKLVKKGVDWLSNLFGGSRIGSSGNRGLNHMMNLEQDSVDVALEHMNKMMNAASMSQNQAFRGNTYAK